MNDKFETLPIEKQNLILNAAYHVFSKNSYKNSPMNEIASMAHISKSLVFYYFHNKKELYCYLWNHCARFTIETLSEYHCYDMKDFFDVLDRGMQAKLKILRQYPDMGMFVVRTYYEKDPTVSEYIQNSYQTYLKEKADQTFSNLDPKQFIEGIDIKMMVQVCIGRVKVIYGI